MTADQFPVTQEYGYDPTYPLNGGFHKGVDYGCPTGTAVVVNGVTIGLSGATGAVTGPHLHVGRWVGGKATNPGRGGFTFDNAKVTEVGQDNTNGRFVRLQADGASWVYLHLSQQLVSVGQELKGGNTMPYVDQAVLDDLEGWKKMGEFLSNQPAFPAMGGKAGEYLRDPSGIRTVLDDYEKVKQNSQASYEEVNEKLYRRK